MAKSDISRWTNQSFTAARIMLRIVSVVLDEHFRAIRHLHNPRGDEVLQVEAYRTMRDYLTPTEIISIGCQGARQKLTSTYV